MRVCFVFPVLLYWPSAQAFLIGSGLSLIAALLGALGGRAGTRSLYRRPQAMQPPAPPAYSQGPLRQDPGFASWLDQPD